MAVCPIDEVTAGLAVIIYAGVRANP